MDNSARLWFQKSINDLAKRRVAQALAASGGTALPCSVVSVNGAVVTVKFEVNASPWTLPEITIPKLESNWIRMPTQVGDLGWCLPADAFLGGVSGLGSGVADLATPGNLEALVFAPISHKSSPPIDQNAAQIQGPNGAIIRTTTGTTSSVVTNASGTTITFGPNTLTVNGSEISGTVGTTSLVMTDASITMTAGGVPIVLDASGLSINGVQFMAHMHTGVATGTSNTGGVV